MSIANTFLGVISSFARQHEGIVLMDISEARRNKLWDLTEEILVNSSLPSGLAASLFGKARFALSPCFGVVGKACLQPIMAREYEKGEWRLTPDLADSVEFLQYISQHLKPREFPLLPSDDDAVLVFVDAEAEMRNGVKVPTGVLGFVVVHPEFGTAHAHKRVPPELVEFFDSIRKCNHYVCQFELLSVLCPFVSLPAEWFKDRPVEIYSDNAGVVGIVTKGYSGKPECARIVNLLHFMLAQLQITSVWTDYVPTESNIADIPTRLHLNDYTDEELELLGRKVEMVIPTLVDASGRWLSYTAIAIDRRSID